MSDQDYIVVSAENMIDLNKKIKRVYANRTGLNPFNMYIKDEFLYLGDVLAKVKIEYSKELKSRDINPMFFDWIAFSGVQKYTLHKAKVLLIC